jgi:hypothetical protein
LDRTVAEHNTIRIDLKRCGRIGGDANADLAKLIDDERRCVGGRRILDLDSVTGSLLGNAEGRSAIGRIDNLRGAEYVSKVGSCAVNDITLGVPIR